MRSVETHSQEERPLVYFGLLFLAKALNPLYCSVSELTILHIVVGNIERFEADGVSIVTPVVDCTEQSDRFMSSM